MLAVARCGRRRFQPSGGGVGGIGGLCRAGGGRMAQASTRQRSRFGPHAAARGGWRGRPLSSPASTPPPQLGAAGMGGRGGGWREACLVGAVGFGGGFAGSLVGLGGGFIMVPGLTAVAGLTQHAASASSLVAAGGTGFAGSVGYATGAGVDWEAAAAIMVVSPLTAALGAKFAGKLSARSLKTILGCVMVLVAPTVPLKKHLLRKRPEDGREGERDRVGAENDGWMVGGRSVKAVAALAATGAAAGIMSGLLGVGGGAILVPALCLVTDLPQHVVLGTALAGFVPSALFGSVVHFRAGNVHSAVWALALGAALGAFAGSNVALGIDEDTLAWLFSGFMVTMGARTLWAVRRMKL